MTHLELAAAFAIAVAIDVRWGDPPNAWHPVAWLGRMVEPLRRNPEASSRLRQWALGIGIALVVPVVFVGSAQWALDRVEDYGWLQGALAVFLLKSTFAIRGLGRAALHVRNALASNDLSAARTGLGALCSRDASAAPPEALIEGTVESVAENASDSAVAPFFYLALFGLPGALYYRAVNTLDAMIGYRGRYEILGKASARLDDVLNWAPARLTAITFLLVGACMGLGAKRGVLVVHRDGSKTPSPNAGRPMAAAAGLLGVQLGKPGVYQLGDPRRSLELADIDRAWHLARTSMLVLAALCLVTIVWRPW